MIGTTSHNLRNTSYSLLGLLIVFLVIFSNNLIAKDLYTVFKTEKGALIVCNASKAYFTVELPGKSFKHVPMEGIAFIVDGHLIQVLLANPAEFSKPDDPPQTILQKYRDWEVKYREKLLKHELIPKVIEDDMDANTDAALWEVSMPEEVLSRLHQDPNGNNNIKNLWATRVVGDLVVVISMPVFKKDNEMEVLSLFHKISNSFKKYDKPLDPTKIQKQLRK